MIYIDVLKNTIRRGARKGDFKRLRKGQWTNEPLRVAIPKANALLAGCYALDGPKCFYNFRVVEKKGRVVGMPEGEYYYYQMIEYDIDCFWGDKMNDFLAQHGLKERL